MCTAECLHDHTSNNLGGKLSIKEVLNGVYLDSDVGYCIFATDHFMFCLSMQKGSIKLFQKVFQQFCILLTLKEHIVLSMFCPSTCDYSEV